jgi:hypothetical protein
MVSRLPQQWASIDLQHATNLARCLADIEVNRAAILREGTLMGKGSEARLNPRLSLIDTLNRRAMSLTRILQLHAVATIGHTQHQEGTKAEAATAAAVLKEAAAHEADTLLARPRLAA